MAINMWEGVVGGYGLPNSKGRKVPGTVHLLHSFGKKPTGSENKSIDFVLKRNWEAVSSSFSLKMQVRMCVCVCSCVCTNECVCAHMCVGDCMWRPLEDIRCHLQELTN